MGGRGGSSHRGSAGGGARDERLPLSLQFFAGKEAAYIQNIIRQYRLSVADVAYMHGQLEKIISENDPAMRVRRDYVEAIIDSHFKNQMETGTSQGANLPDTRARLSAAYFGHPYDRVNKTTPDTFEKYGYLAPRDKVAAMQASAGWYGDVVFRFKRDAVMERTTFKTDDTLNVWSGTSDAIAGSLKRASIAGVNDLDRTTVQKMKRSEQYIHDPDRWVASVSRGSYFELQYHGHLGIDDVDSVTFGNTLPGNFDSILRKLKRKGVKVYQVKGGDLHEF